MKSLLLFSVFLAAMLIPALAARDPSPRRGVKRMLVLLLAANVLYALYVTMIHPFAFVPHWQP
jgi:hypothetical protein